MRLRAGLRCNIYSIIYTYKLRPRRRTSPHSDVIIPSKTRRDLTLSIHSLGGGRRGGRGETYINNKIPIFARDSGPDVKLVIQIYTFIKTTVAVNRNIKLYR